MKISDAKGWAKIELIRGIPVRYKGSTYLFPTVYMRESGVDDFSTASASAEVKMAKESGDVESVLTMKFLEMLCRVSLKDAYPVEQLKVREEMYVSKSKIKKLKSKIEELLSINTEDDKEERLAQVEKLSAELKEEEANTFDVSLPFIGEQTLLPFRTDDLTSVAPRVRTTDYARLMKVYQLMNLNDEEELEDFFTI